MSKTLIRNLCHPRCLKHLVSRRSTDPDQLRIGKTVEGTTNYTCVFDGIDIKMHDEFGPYPHDLETSQNIFIEKIISFGEIWKFDFYFNSEVGISENDADSTTKVCAF